MKRTILIGTVAASLLAPFAAAHAHSDASVSLSTPEFGIRIGGPVYRPVPVYVPPPVVVPAPVYAPPPVYVTPRVVYGAPVVVAPVRFAPRYYYGPPAGVWVAPRLHGHRHGDAWRDGPREHRRDRDGYRAGYGF